MDKCDRDWIRKSSYEDMLRRWRFAPAGDTIFKCKRGELFHRAMLRKKRQLSEAEQVAVSKRVGW